MTGRHVTEAALQLEVRELTGLLRRDDSFAGLRDLLAVKGIPASAAVLAGLIEGEDLTSYGVILTPDRECVVFETAPDDSLIRWEVVDDPETLADSFQAVLAGIAMVRAGQIS